MATVVDVEQLVLLLELSPPFGKKDVQSARRTMAKRWHPDLAPIGKEHEHERHLKAINEAADHLEALAEQSRGGKVSANAVKVAGQAARRARAEEGRRNYEAQQRAAEQDADRQKHDPFGSRMPDHSVVHRYARCLSYPEWGVGTVDGIYFTGEGDHVQQWARVRFSHGIRTVPAGSLQFVDFSRPDPAADRVERFMTAARHALAENDFETAAQRLTYARDAQPRNPVVLRLITFAFWQSGNLAAAGRAVRDWIRVEPDVRRHSGTRRESTRRWAPPTSPSEPPRPLPTSRRPMRAAGSGSADCASRASIAPGPSRRSSGPGPSGPRWRACWISRSPTSSPATWAPRSPPASRRRWSIPTPPRHGAASPTRSRAPIW